ncbi:hypothetical protein [Escherichia coli]|nr:hypothetical protein [Escherichia coli]
MSDKVTVKQTINKATSIYKIEQITVGNHGSLAAANRGVAEYELSE